MSQTDRIEKRAVLRAPRSRVWRALTDAAEFGAWFGMKIDGTFEPGVSVLGRITTPGYEGVPVEMRIQAIQPEKLFSYRWHPGVIEPPYDFANEPTTLVEVRLADVEGGTGTLLTIVESGFDALPASRRAEAFRMNDGGWSEQIRNIERHVAPPA